MISLYSL